MKSLSLALILIFISLNAQATIYLDYEVEPLPLVDISGVLPVGFDTGRAGEVGSANLLPDILQSGTHKIKRQDFLEKLGEFGASYEFGVANRHATWSLSFPVVEQKNYDGLTQILSENWREPRFEAKTFNLARLKFEASVKSTLDSDAALSEVVVQRWFKKFHLGIEPFFVEDIKALKLAQTQKIFARDFQSVKDIWVGVVAPQAQLELVKSILKSVFNKQGEIALGPHLEAFPLFTPSTVKVTASKEALILDKPGRAQAVLSVIGFYPGHVTSDEELPFFFGHHVFFDAGLGAVFPEEIRTKRGLAYAVQSAGMAYLGLSEIGVVMNPVAEKAGEAYRVTADVLRRGFETDELVKNFPAEAWNRDWRSFKFGRILSNSNPSGRLSEREDVVLGGMSPEFYKSQPENWKTDRAGVSKTLNHLWNASTVILATVGDAKTLKPLIEKSFPDYKVKVIPYRDSLTKKGYLP